MDKQRAYTERIRESSPALPIKSATLNEESQNNDVLTVNDEIIFRFPKYDDGVSRLEVETAILAGIQSHITAVRVPDPEYVSLEPTVGRAFVGYRMIRGELATDRDFAEFGESQPFGSIPNQLATFLKELHNVPVDQSIGVELPTYDTHSYWEDMYTRVREALFSHMTFRAQDQVQRHFETFLDDAQDFEYEPVLRHGDFGTGNILIDRETMTVTGMLDFGSAGLGDPAVDVGWVQYLSGVGESFLQTFYAAYPGLQAVLDRARFYVGTFAIQDALFGAENNDTAAFERGIASYV